MNVNLSRRNFLVGTSAFSMGVVANPVPAAPKPNLRFGVLSDIHITDWASGEIFRRTLRYFRDLDVDAVLIAGDMADHGILPQLQNVAKSWFSVFPDDRGLGGKKVERLFIYGNHDPEGLGYRDAAMDKAFLAMNMTYEEAAKFDLRKIGLGKAWSECFHEEYSPIYTKNVKGYDFIGGHWDPANGSRWGAGPAIDEWMKANGSKIDTSKPFFYFQHPHPLGTVFAGDSWGEDAGATTRTFAAHPFATVFSGHSHRPISDGRNYWREEFTSIGTGTLSYLCMPDGRKGRKDYREKLDGRCGQVVDVFDDRLVVARRDFFNDEDIDGNVVLAMPVRTSSFSVRGVGMAERPAFAKSAKVAVRLDGRRVLDFSFPGAFDNSTARPFDYTVKVETRVPGVAVWNSWAKSELWAQPEAVLSRRRAIAAGDVKGRIDLAGLPSKANAVRLRVTARNSYGFTGGELVGEWVDLV